MTAALSASNRKTWLNEMEDTTYDILVIGGGITGAGIALDAQSRGMKTALVEMQDFAAGTSSRSTKLVHGGLRYLKQFEVKMVAEVGKERAVVYENGPHVTTPEWMLLPIYKGGTFGRFTTSIGLNVYDRLAGVKRSERRTMLSREEVLAKEPLLREEGLLGGGIYVEYRTDDARLTLEVMKKAVELGARAVNYAKVARLVYQDGMVCGAEVVDQIGGNTFTIRARKIINAAGPWVGDIREMDASNKGKTLRLTKGVHLVFDESRFPLRQAVYFDTPDGRMVFAIPRDGKTYVGTTDTDYKEDPARPAATEADRDYLLHAVNDQFRGLALTPADVESSWAGVRPLIYEEGKSPSEVSRKDEIFRSPTGLITIAGGKLTGYRKMAETVVDLAARELAASGSRYKACLTRELPISGGEVGGSAGLAEFVRNAAEAGKRTGMTAAEATRLAARYGSNVNKLYELAGQADDGNLPGGLPRSLYAEVMYAMDYEMACTPTDFFIRRTGAMFFDMACVERWRDAVTEWMAERLAWTDEQLAQYENELSREIAEARLQAKG